MSWSLISLLALQSSEDLTCHYLSPLESSYGIDRFGFHLDIGETFRRIYERDCESLTKLVRLTMIFGVKYTAEGCGEWWDNNWGMVGSVSVSFFVPLNSLTCPVSELRGRTHARPRLAWHGCRCPWHRTQLDRSWTCYLSRTSFSTLLVGHLATAWDHHTFVAHATWWNGLPAGFAQQQLLASDWVRCRSSLATRHGFDWGRWIGIRYYRRFGRWRESNGGERFRQHGRQSRTSLYLDLFRHVNAAAQRGRPSLEPDARVSAGRTVSERLAIGEGKAHGVLCGFHL